MPAAPAKPLGKPWITANQVTLARLVPMPLLAWLIYQAGGIHPGSPYLWSALIAGTLIGCTDWVDGLLARKYGPTVLGGLLDPIADKVFTAFAYAPFAAIGLVPWWAVALMFSREFFVTALRSAYEQRGLTLKTSYFAKVKTWTQMQGIGVMLLFPLVENQRILTWILVVLAVAPLVATAVFWIVKRKFWRGSFVMSGSVAAVLGVYVTFDIPTAIWIVMIGIVAVTWASGVDYLVIGWRQLRGRGDFAMADGVRIVGSLALPVLAFAVLVAPGAPQWPIYTILAFELAVGGLDNLLSHHRVATKALAWGGRVLGISVLLAAALLLPAYVAPLTIVAALGSVIGVSAEFWRGRDYYMDARIRNKALRAAATS